MWPKQERVFGYARLFHCELVKVSLSCARPDLRNTGEVEGTQREMSQMPSDRRELVRKTEVSLSCSACWESLGMKRQSRGSSWAR